MVNRRYFYETSGEVEKFASGSDLLPLLTVLEEKRSSGELTGAAVSHCQEDLPAGLPWDGVCATREVMLQARTAYHWKEIGALPLGSGMQMMYRIQGLLPQVEMVGRDPELRRLVEALEARRVVYVSGASGMGKSVLIEAFRREAQLRNILVQTQVIRKGGNALAGKGESPQDRAAFIYEDLVGHAGAVVLIVDDIQWATDFQRLVVKRLAARVGQNFFLLLAGRDTVNVADLVDERIELQPFGKEDIAALRARLAPELEDDGALLDRVRQQTGGHPLLTVELLKSWNRMKRLGQENEFNVSSGEDSVRLASLLRSSGMPVGLAELAVLRGRFDRDRVIRLLTERGIDPDLDELLQDDALIDAGGGYEFRHALIRRGIFDSLSAQQQGELHVAAAVLLERAGDSDAGYHWEEAGRSEQAMACYRAVSQELFQEGEVTRGGEYSRRAIDLGGDTPELWWGDAMMNHNMGRHTQAAKSFSSALKVERLSTKLPLVLELGKSLLRKSYSVPGLSAEQGVQAYRANAEIAWLEHRLEDCALSILRSHRSALRLGKDHGERLESAAARAMALGPDMPGWWVEAEFRKIGASLDGSHAEKASACRMYRLLYLMGTERWCECLSDIRSERKTAMELRLYKNDASLGFLETANLFFADRVEESLSVVCELVRRMKDYGEENLTGLAIGTEACVKADISGPLAGLRILEENEDLRGIPEHESLVMRAGFSAQIGELDVAEQACRNFLLLLERHPVSYYAFSMVLPCWGDALFLLRQKGLLSRNEAEKSLRFMRRHGAKYPAAKGYPLALKGLLDQNPAAVKTGIDRLRACSMELHVRRLNQLTSLQIS